MVYICLEDLSGMCIYLHPNNILLNIVKYKLFKIIYNVYLVYIYYVFLDLFKYSKRVVNIPQSGPDLYMNVQYKWKQKKK